MGLSESTPVRLNTEQREDREKSKKMIAEQRKFQIEQVQKQLLNGNGNGNMNGNGVLIETKDLISVIKVSEKAKTQLDRGGSALTKADLIAVLISLQPENRNKIAQIETLTVSDINSMIRSIIYDPSRLIKYNSNNSANHSNLQLDEKMEGKEKNLLSLSYNK